MDSELMFEKAKKLVHQRGAVHDQQQALKPDTPAPVEAVSNKPTQKHKKFNHQNHNQRPKAPTEASKKCSCGKGAHSLMYAQQRMQLVINGRRKVILVQCVPLKM